jgi:hypothetical protein
MEVSTTNSGCHCVDEGTQAISVPATVQAVRCRKGTPVLTSKRVLEFASFGIRSPMELDEPRRIDSRCRQRRG